MEVSISVVFTCIDVDVVVVDAKVVGRGGSVGV